MNDGELSKLVERTDAKLRVVYDVWMANFRESRYMADFLFTQDEKKAWLQAEPNFPKPIAH
jgi:hypothetical protein